MLPRLTVLDHAQKENLVSTKQSVTGMSRCWWSWLRSIIANEGTPIKHLRVKRAKLSRSQSSSFFRIHAYVAQKAKISNHRQSRGYEEGP